MIWIKNSIYVVYAQQYILKFPNLKISRKIWQKVVKLTWRVVKKDTKLGVFCAFNDIFRIIFHSCLFKNQLTIEILGYFVSHSFGSKHVSTEKSFVIDSNCGSIFSFFVFVFGSVSYVPFWHWRVSLKFFPMSRTGVIT